MEEQSIQPIVEKIESLFSKFNHHFYNDELEKPIITVSPDTTKGAYGWCTGWKAWSTDANAEEQKRFYEINLCAEYLSRPFEKVAETLLHEMAHLYNLLNNTQDTSRGGTYHNKRYKEVAETHGLKVKKHEKYGWAITCLNDHAKAYIDNLQNKQFEIFRPKIEKAKGKGKQSTRKYICPECGCIIRATKEVFIVCGVCNERFEEA